MKSILVRLKGIIKNGFFHILFGSVLAKAISFISSIVIVRLVDKTQYAYITYAYNLYAYLTLLEGLGLSTVLLKYCSGETDPKKDRAYFLFALKWGTAFELGISLLACLAVIFIELPFPEAKHIIWILALLPSLGYVLSIFQSYCRAHLENRRYAAAGLAQAICVCILSIALVLTVGTYGVLWARYLSIIAGLAICASFVFRAIRGVPAAPLGCDEKKQVMKMGIGVMVSSIFSQIMPLNESTLISHLIQDEAVTSNYRVAGLIPEQLLLLTGAIAVYYFPYLSKMKDGRDIMKKAVHIGLVNAAIIIFGAVIGVLLTPVIIRWVYGPAYHDAELISRWLWVVRAANACMRMIPMNTLIAVGKTRFLAISSTAVCAVHFAIDYLMISYWGIKGVAYASIIVYILSGMMYWSYLRRSCRRMVKEENE